MKHKFLDQHSDRDSFIHRLDPRAKAMAFFSLILFVVFTPPSSLSAFLFYGGALFIIAMMSGVPLRFIFTRSLVIVPFVLAIGAFIPFMKEGTAMAGYSLGALKITATREGALLFWNILIKAYLSCLSMILLTSTTRFADLLKGFERMHFPRLIIMILSFMYRYIYLFTDELMRMKVAKDARSAGGGRWFHIRALANMLGVFFIRAYERGERVYLAMCSRGFDGTVKTLNTLKLGMKDIYIASLFMAMLVAIRYFAK